MKKNLSTLFCLLTIVLSASAQKGYQQLPTSRAFYTLRSPDGKLQAQIFPQDTLLWSVTHEGDPVLHLSPLYMELEDGSRFGVGSRLKNALAGKTDQQIPSPFYKKESIEDRYNELVLNFREDFRVVFRAYNEGMAYRFVSTGHKDFVMKNEQAVFHFDRDYTAYVPYVKGKHTDIESQYFNSFENTYAHAPLSELHPERLMFTPVVVELEGGKKVCIAESDLENYPGMFLKSRKDTPTLCSDFANYPVATEQGGHNQLQQIVTARAPYIARCKAGAHFPWRVLIVSTEDRQLADNDMVYKLAAPSRLRDISWIRPGKVAWEWWNHWGLSGVDFEAGVNNETYMAYIDFASRHGIEYVILDEGWAVNLQADLFQVVPEIDLEKLIAYGREKKVDLILWVGYYAFERDMEEVCRHYSEMGIKGFKIDFMDRDDQPMVDFHYRAAETAARYRMLVDFHGSYKPTGMNRTYPNVINYEAVHGLEQMKWTDIHTDQVTYDVTMPFIRMVAGPVDYTQGAMRNATKHTFRGINDEPMSQGTRCRQLAQYVVFESPLNMLCDSPVHYEREAECTAFIAAIPTVWDETVAMHGEIGKYISMARRRGETWYVGSLTNWDARTLELDLSFLGEGDFAAELYTDGANAHRIASDYACQTIAIPSDRKLSVSLAQGGGSALKIYKR